VVVVMCCGSGGKKHETEPLQRKIYIHLAQRATQRRDKT
jgi:hypothetical protein